jgi:glutathione S-transferase
MITEGSFKILGGNNIFLIYLCNSHQRIKDKLYPAEAKGEIEKHLAWFLSRMRPCAGRLTRMIVQPQAFGDKAPSQAELQREQDEFFKKLLPSLDQQLKNKKYFCGDEVTVADLQYYNEISTVVNLTKKDLDETEYPNLSIWFNERMSQIPDIMILDKKLRDIISKYNF